MLVNYKKYADELVPAIIQDSKTLRVLMLGFMNEEAVNKTLSEKKVTFYSRTKNRLWTKGEESGNFLYLESMAPDCDNDTLLVKVKPAGPVCHTGTDPCWAEENKDGNFLNYLETVIEQRKQSTSGSSYVRDLFGKGINKLAQKVGEEAIEMVIEAKDSNEELFLNESADLLFHYLLLLNAKGYNLQDVIRILQLRHSK